MKVIHFMSKYPETERANTLDRRRGDEFVDDMAAELKSYIDMTATPVTLKKFNWAVSQVRAKWESIFQLHGVSEPFWNFFYATRVIPIRNKILSGLDADEQTSQEPLAKPE